MTRPEGTRRELLGAGGRFRISWFDTVDSTNRYLLDAARSGADEGAVAVADHQTAGRGRMGRAWHDDPDAALLASVLLRPAVHVDHAHRYTTAVAVALADAVRRCTGTMPLVKWPNDLVVDDRKLAGVLAEADLAADGTVRALVVGAGTNVRSVPPEYRDTAVTCDALAGRAVDREELLLAWLDALAPLLERPDDAIARAREQSATLGRTVRVEFPGRELIGVAEDLTAEGALVVRDEAGVRHEVHAGDVVHLRPA